MRAKQWNSLKSKQEITTTLSNTRQSRNVYMYVCVACENALKKTSVKHNLWVCQKKTLHHGELAAIGANKESASNANKSILNTYMLTKTKTNKIKNNNNIINQHKTKQIYIENMGNIEKKTKSFKFSIKRKKKKYFIKLLHIYVEACVGKRTPKAQRIRTKLTLKLKNMAM